MQIKTMRYHYIPIQMANMKNIGKEYSDSAAWTVVDRGSPLGKKMVQA